MNRREGESDMTQEPLRRSPYQGLMPYGEEDAAFFFGREKEARLIIANLFASPLTLLYGASGVGKSSVLRAGVANQLRGREDVLAVVFNAWQTDPLVDLKAAVARAAHRAHGSPVSLDAAATLDEYLAECAEKLGRRLMIILDQFEEYFLYHAQDDTFASEFPRAVMKTDSPVSFLISLREDSLASLDRFEGRIPTLFDNYLRVEHLNSVAARAAIEKPVEHYNSLHGASGDAVRIEPELVSEVLKQVEAGKVVLGDAGRGAVRESNAESQIETPYLQLVMLRLWNEETNAGSKVLRLQTLDALGGAKRIVRTHLDAAMGALPTGEQSVAASIFHYLVTPSGTKIAHTARDLAEYAQLPQEKITQVLEDLSGGDVRILRSVDPPPDQPSTPRYEIFHDVLASAVLDWRSRYVLARLRERGRRKRLFYVGAVIAASLIFISVGLYVHWRKLAEAEKDKEVLLKAEREAQEQKEEAVSDYGEVFLTYQKTVALLDNLSSEEPEDRRVAIENIKRLAEEGRLPPELAPTIRELVARKDPAQSAAVYKAIQEAEKSNNSQTSSEAPAELTPLVFVQFSEESMRAQARQLEAQLEKSGYSVPGIEKTNRGPKTKQLRYFHKSDEREANTIAGNLSGAGWGAIETVYVPGYEKTKIIRQRQYEFWFEDTQTPVGIEIVLGSKTTPGQTNQEPANKSHGINIQLGSAEKAVIVAGAFPEAQLDAAQKLLYSLQQGGYPDARVEKSLTKAGELRWQVLLGPYPGDDARRILRRVHALAPEARIRQGSNPE